MSMACELGRKDGERNLCDLTVIDPAVRLNIHRSAYLERCLHQVVAKLSRLDSNGLNVSHIQGFAVAVEGDFKRSYTLMFLGAA